MEMASESNDGNLKWPIDDLQILYSRIEAHLPENDNLSFKSREMKMPWDKIVFAHYSAEDCFKAWKMARKQTRSFRLLSEVVQDTRGKTFKILTDEPAKVYPPKPKSSRNIFVLFLADYKKMHPDIPQKTQFTAASEAYHKLSEEEKEKYIKMAKQDKIRYQKELSEYRSKFPELNLTEKESKKTVLNPFNLYFDEQKHNTDILDELKGTSVRLREYYKKKWDGMSDSDKLVWVEKAYTLGKELEEMNSGSKNFKFEKKGNILTKNETWMRDRALGKPIAPPASAYNLFFQKMLHSKKISEVPNLERMKWVSERWKMLSSSEKTFYQNRIKELREEYKQKYVDFLESLDPITRDQIIRDQKKPVKVKKPIKSLHNEDIKSEILGNSSKDQHFSDAELIEEVQKKKKKRKNSHVPHTVEIISENVTEREDKLSSEAEVIQETKKKKKKRKNSHMDVLHPIETIDSYLIPHQDKNDHFFNLQEDKQSPEEEMIQEVRKKKKKRKNSHVDVPNTIEIISENITDRKGRHSPEGEVIQDVKKKKKRRKNSHFDVPHMIETIDSYPIFHQDENDHEIEMTSDVDSKREKKKKKRVSTIIDDITDYIPDTEERTHKKKKKKKHHNVD